ncbi:hypothetical protein MKX08_005165 [Trichoderma sp. CBMAI-0020]|nr:hypothetical protein MKX08_005165 [Trichoderma sp. CBMAI-0020]
MMETNLTLLILVTGFAGEDNLQDTYATAIQKYLQQRFGAHENLHVLKFSIVDGGLSEKAVVFPPNIDAISERLLQMLERKKSSFEKEYKPEDVASSAGSTEEDSFMNPNNPRLLFFAHDVGGLVVKKALLLAIGKAYEWISLGTIALLFFETPHAVPKDRTWDNIIALTLVTTSRLVDFSSFLRNLSHQARQIEQQFKAISGSYHHIDFMTRMYQSLIENYGTSANKAFGVIPFIELSDSIWTFMETPVWGATQTNAIKKMVDNADTLWDVTQMLTLIKTIEAPSDTKEAEMVIERYSIHKITEKEESTSDGIELVIAWDLEASLIMSLGPLIQIIEDRIQLHPIYQPLVTNLSHMQTRKHKYLAFGCISYLKATMNTWDDVTQTQLPRLHQFIEYAALNWPFHYYYGCTEDIDGSPTHELVLSFLDTHLDPWIRIFSRYSKGLPTTKRLPVTRLQAICYFGFGSLLKKILQTGCCDNKESELAMELAAENGHFRLVKLLADQGIWSKEALKSLIRLGTFTAVKDLLGLGENATDGERQRIDRLTSSDVLDLVTQAVKCGNIDCFLLLKDKAARSFFKCEATGINLLHIAARIGHTGLVRNLLDSGSSLEKLDEFGYTAMGYAAEGGFIQVADILVAEAKKRFASSESRSSFWSIDDTSICGNTALHLAALNGHTEMVKFLLRNNANPRLRNDRDYTPLHCASMRGFQAIAKSLLDSLSSYNKLHRGTQSSEPIDQEPRESSLLKLAVQSQHIGILEILKQHKSYCGRQELRDAMTEACQGGHEEILFYLLRWHQQDYPHHEPFRDDFGNTVLHLTARIGNADLFFNIFKVFKLPIDKFNHAGRSPLHEAAASGCLSILQRFQELSSFSMKTKETTPKSLLYLAIENRQIHIAEWLARHYNTDKSNSLTNAEAILAVKKGKGYENLVGQLIEAGYMKMSGSLLYSIVENGWIKIVRTAIEQTTSSKDYSIQTWKDSDSGNTALHYASQYRNTAMCVTLFQGGWDAYSKNDEGLSPFSIAVKENLPDVVHEFLQAPQDTKLDETDNEGMTPLLCACQGGVEWLRIVQLLLKQEKIKAGLERPYPEGHEFEGKTPLLVVSRNLIKGTETDDSLFKLLLDNGANVDCVDDSNHTPLDIAARYGHLECVRELLARGAQVEHLCEQMGTPIHHAVQGNNREIIQLLVDNKAKMNEGYLSNWIPFTVTPLILAFFYEQKLSYMALIELGASLSHALFFAAATSDVEVTQLILEKDPTEKLWDSYLGNPLCSAILSEKEESVTFLLSQPKAELNEGGKTGSSPLILAVISESEDLVEQLLARHEVNVNLRDCHGRSALDYAILQNEEAIVKRLCGHRGIKLDEVDSRGHSPLYLAARGSSDTREIFDIVDTACENLDIRAYAQLCEKALHGALAAGESSVFSKLLRVQGVRADVQDTDGWTPLDYAIAYGRQEEKVELEDWFQTDGGTSPDHRSSTANNVKRFRSPSGWHEQDRHKALFVMPREQDQGPSQPLDPTFVGLNRKDYYFEIQVTKFHKQEYDFSFTIFQDGTNTHKFELLRNLGIGLADEIAPLSATLGVGSGISKKFGEGDTIGCGFNAENNTIYFKKNGERLVETFPYTSGKLFPAVFFNYEAGNIKCENITIQAKFPR